MPSYIFTRNDTGGNVGVGKIECIKPLVPPIPLIDIDHVVKRGVPDRLPAHCRNSLGCIGRIKAKSEQLRLREYKIVKLCR